MYKLYHTRYALKKTVPLHWHIYTYGRKILLPQLLYSFEEYDKRNYHEYVLMMIKLYARVKN